MASLTTLVADRPQVAHSDWRRGVCCEHMALHVKLAFPEYANDCRSVVHCCQAQQLGDAQVVAIFVDGLQICWSSNIRKTMWLANHFVAALLQGIRGTL